MIWRVLSVILAVLLLLVVAVHCGFGFDYPEVSDTFDLAEIKFVTQGIPPESIFSAFENGNVYRLAQQYSDINEETVLACNTVDGERTNQRLIHINRYDNEFKIISTEIFDPKGMKYLSWCKETMDGGYILRFYTYRDAENSEKIDNKRQNGQDTKLDLYEIDNKRVYTITVVKIYQGEIQWSIEKTDFSDTWCKCFTETTDSYIFGGEYDGSIHFLKLLKNGDYEKETFLRGNGNVRFFSLQSEETGLVFDFYTECADGDFSALEGQREQGEYGVGIYDLSLSEVSFTFGEYEIKYSTIGYHEGRPVTRRDPLFDDFEFGIPRLIMDCDDGYLVLSRQDISGAFEFDEVTNAKLRGYRIIVSCFDSDGGLVWQVADS